MPNIPEYLAAWDEKDALRHGHNGEMLRVTLLHAADTALEHFSSWEEYGRSFIMGRGVWHGDPTDSETAYEIVELLLKNCESPWKQSMWKE